MSPLALLILIARASSAPAEAFGPGEQLTFLLHYFTLVAGSVQMTVGADTDLDGHDVRPIVMFARTESLFRLYPVDDKFVTFWDPKQHRTLGSDFFADEGGHRRRLRIQLDHQLGKALVRQGSEDAPPRTETVDVEPGAFDMCAVAYAIRELPLRVGDHVELPVFTGRNAFHLTANVETPEETTVPAGKFSALRLAVQAVFLGKLQTTGDVRVWVTDDERHVPIRIEGSFLLGSLTAELSDVKGKTHGGR